MKKSIIAALSIISFAGLLFAAPKENKKNDKKPNLPPKEFEKPETITLSGTISSNTDDDKTFYTLTTEDGKTYILLTEDKNRRERKDMKRPEPPKDKKLGKKAERPELPKEKPVEKDAKAKDENFPEPPKLLTSEELSALVGKTASVTGFRLESPKEPCAKDGKRPDFPKEKAFGKKDGEKNKAPKNEKRQNKKEERRPEPKDNKEQVLMDGVIFVTEAE